MALLLLYIIIYRFYYVLEFVLFCFCLVSLHNGGFLPGIRRGRRGQTSPGEERGNESGKVAFAHGSVEFWEATSLGLADES